MQMWVHWVRERWRWPLKGFQHLSALLRGLASASVMLLLGGAVPEVLPSAIHGSSLLSSHSSSQNLLCYYDISNSNLGLKGFYFL